MTAARRKVARKSAAKKSVARKSAAKKPAARKPAARKPAAKKPAARKPVARRSAAGKPLAGKPSARKPAARPARARAAAPASIPALMGYALWLELDAVERYRELADAMEMHNNRDVADLFRRMAAIESKHADRIMKQMDWSKVPPPPAGPAPWAGAEGPETVAHEEVHYLMQPYHALALALKGEEQALRFFEALERAASVPAVKRAAAEMADEEREHVALVKNWMARVPPPDDGWRDDPDPPRYTD